MKLSRLVLLVLTSLPLLGCNNGGECDKCSNDTDCKAGLVCSDFSDGSRRCGTGTGASTCRVH